MMTFRETRVAGAFVIEAERHEDERGFFARTFSAEELGGHGLDGRVAESSLAYNPAAFTLRGLHYQRPPHEETKLVRCTRGSVYDVVVDLRDHSATRLHWDAVELSDENRLALYVPEGCAHGYLTLTDASELTYLISHPYVEEAAAGVRWDDPLIGIQWPAAPAVIGARDASYPDLVA
jgi:dTDP-4-dehydrorhamnose 3,5-epimerase